MTKDGKIKERREKVITIFRVAITCQSKGHDHNDFIKSMNNIWIISNENLNARE